MKRTDGKKFGFGRFFAIVIVVVLVIGLVVDIGDPQFGFFAKVDAGNVGIPITFGRVGDTTLESGFHLTNWFTHITQMDIRTQRISGNLEVFSSDIQQVNVMLSANYNIDAAVAMNLYRTVGTSYEEKIIQPRLLENTKVIFAKYNAEALIEHRNDLSGSILELMQEEMAPYGITVSAISIENIDFTDAFTDAVEAKVVATQNKIRTVTEQEQATAVAQAEAQREVIAAEAEASVAKIRADAEAYSVRVNAEALAEGNELVSKSLTDELIRYTEAQNWNGELPQIVGSDTVLPVLDTAKGEKTE